MPQTDYIMEHGDIAKAIQCLVTNEVLPADSRGYYEHIMGEIFVSDRATVGPDGGRAEFMETLAERTVELAKLIKEHCHDDPILVPTLSMPRDGLGGRGRMHGVEGELIVRQIAAYDMLRGGIRVIYDLQFQKARTFDAPINIDFRYTYEHS
jgi:hypothetical protein